MDCRGSSFCTWPVSASTTPKFDAEGRRYIRHGDIGKFDEDGFLILMDRAKDMIKTMETKHAELQGNQEWLRGCKRCSTRTRKHLWSR